MKAINKIISITASLVTLSAMTLISSCGGPEPEPEPTAAEIAAINLTTSAWKVNAVTIDGVDKSSMFANFSLTFTPASTVNGQASSLNGSFTSTNGGVVWPSSGTWTVNPDGKSLSRGDGITIQLTELTQSSLKMSLPWSKTTFGTGRTAGLKGQHEFTMGK